MTLTSTATANAGIERALVVTAHPDDVDFGAAGTIATWVAAGITVTYCVCTPGDAGGFDQTPRERMAELRQEEQRAAAKAVGVGDVRFLDYLDGQLTVSLSLREDIARVIRAVRPQRVLTHSPEIDWARIVVSHPDHRAVGEATFAAIYPDARNPFAFPRLLEQEGLEPWTVSELWMSESPEALANHAVDITDHFDAKMAALRAHHSQTAHLDDLEESLRSRLADTAEQHGMATGRLAEPFHAVATG